MPKQIQFDSRKKASAVIISLGTETASIIYKFLREDEIEQLTLEIAMLQDLTSEQTEQCLDEFYNLCLAQKYVTEGGIEYAREILNKALGPQAAAVLIERVNKTIRTRSFDFLRKADPKHLISMIQNEHPQTIALILSYLRANQASEILAELPRDLQLDVAQRIAVMDRTSPEMVKEVEKTLSKRFSSVASVDFAEIGGVKYMAEIMNSVDRGTEKYILEEMGKADPGLAEEIRKLMFVFEDITLLDSAAIQRFLREVDTKDLLIALKGSGDEVSQVFYRNMSSRMADMMKEDAQYLHGVRLADVEDAQQRLVAIVRRLEESGEIFISRGGKDEVID
ncbi:MAG TPA: flagellar motor switch protein FliG [Candidatus Acidoferrum sp.]|nr:flagellar motor switch protein FliG [Candidatus Acidoferrum sp.]